MANYNLSTLNPMKFTTLVPTREAVIAQAQAAPFRSRRISRLTPLPRPSILTGSILWFQRCASSAATASAMNCGPILPGEPTNWRIFPPASM